MIRASPEDHGLSTHLSSALCRLLQAPAIVGPTVGRVAVICDQEVVKEDVRGHGPELQAHSAEWGHLKRLQVLKERWVGDLPGLPDALEQKLGLQLPPPTEQSSFSDGSLRPDETYLVVGVVNHGGFPLALVVGIVNRWSFPGSTARSGLTGRVRDLRSLPLSIHILIPYGQEIEALGPAGVSRSQKHLRSFDSPVLRSDSTGVSNVLGLFIQPAVRLHRSFIWNLSRSIFIPDQTVSNHCSIQRSLP